MASTRSTKLPALVPRARALIRKLALEPHPEGGYFREIHRSREEVEAARGTRAALTTIYFLLARGQRSLFHCVRSDEIWHYHEGAPLRLVDVDAALRTKTEYRLGPLGGRAAPVAVIPKDHWQAAESLGDYTLVGCTVGPGFDFADFTLIGEAEGAALRKRHPALSRFTAT